jgi:hypothetical protein
MLPPQINQQTQNGWKKKEYLCDSGSATGRRRSILGTIAVTAALNQGVPAVTFLKDRTARRLRGRFSNPTRRRAKLRQLQERLQRHWQQPLPERGKWLRQVETGHFAYYAVAKTAGRS